MQTKSTSILAFLSPRAATLVLICTAACFVVIPINSGLPSLHSQTSTNSSQRTLTFEERVSYQRAIEDVYWRHRIWPKENLTSKPSLDTVMSLAQIEQKVTEYLRNSQVLEDYWQRPITAEQLQAEMDRMAKQTKQPEVLQELFDALGNDPFVIAECLARPALADRLVGNWYAHDQKIHGDLKQRAQAELQTNPVVGQMKQLSGKYTEIEFVKEDAVQQENVPGAEHSVKLNPHEWDNTTQELTTSFGVQRRDAAAKSADMSAHSKTVSDYYVAFPIGKLSALQEDESRYYVTAVIKETNDHLKLATVSWDKQPLESWLEVAQKRLPQRIATASSGYVLPTIAHGTGCVDNTWTTTASAPSARTLHTAVWTGSEMIVWGGDGAGIGFNTGGRYDPSTDTWTPTSIANAPSERGDHTAVWTGNEMIVWGGINIDGTEYFNTGAKYNPGTNTWTPTTITNAPSGRYSHTAVWTGSEMIVWGGVDQSINYLNTGGRYNPSTNSWTATSITNAPVGRVEHTAILSGGEMIVWGGFDSSNYLNTGGRYNPGTNSWTVTTTANAPSARSGHTAVSSDSEMIIWGGGSGFAVNTGGRYNPTTNSWTATTVTNAPDARADHTAVWTGSEMIVWGGGSAPLNTGGRYNPTTNSWTATTVTNAPDARADHTAVWTGSEMIVWGGFESGVGAGVTDTGARYDPSKNNWVPTSTAPSARYGHTAVWTGTEMIVWGGHPFYLNTGGRYSPSTDTWTATTVTNAPVGRYFHVAIWTGTEMITWGGTDNNAYFNTGGRYDPGADSWAATSTTNAPAGRQSPTAIWTGSEMIVWGGYDGFSTYFNSGGRYNPNTDTWVSTSMTNTPEGRVSHTAVWTGNEMVVWGGCFSNGGVNYLNSGGRYNPNTNSWTATSTTNAPEPRCGHSAVWTGNEMIVWGGTAGIFNDFNTGARYTLGTNSWIATATVNAPEARDSHTAVWTGSEMIVWGGTDGIDLFSTGGRYNPLNDGWNATSTANVPDGRYFHTAVWTGANMIIWGGIDDNVNNIATNTGGRYCAQGGPTPTPTATPSITPIPTPSPTGTPTVTPPPTATPRATPRPRPTPHRRPTLP